MITNTTTPLFSEESDEEEISSPVENTEGTGTVPKKHDKIFHNDYNTGNLDFEEYGPPKVDVDFVEKHMESYYDSNTYFNKMQTMEKLDDFFQSSEIGKTIGLKKKIPKQMIPRLYIAMRGAFNENEIPETEFFTLLAEYFSMSYESFYENIPAIYRETLVRELDNKYGILKRKGLQRLF
jgi:hypothetical protein